MEGQATPGPPSRALARPLTLRRTRQPRRQPRRTCWCNMALPAPPPPSSFSPSVRQPCYSVAARTSLRKTRYGSNTLSQGLPRAYPCEGEAERWRGLRTHCGCHCRSFHRRSDSKASPSGDATSSFPSSPDAFGGLYACPQAVDCFFTNYEFDEGDDQWSTPQDKAKIFTKEGVRGRVVLKIDDDEVLEKCAPTVPLLVI
jgi:hypothetical protein